MTTSNFPSLDPATAVMLKPLFHWSHIHFCEQGPPWFILFLSQEQGIIAS